jgi:hypothetical protein
MIGDIVQPSEGEQVRYVPLGRLLLDKNNPRFGVPDRLRVNQTELLDYVVSTFGVDDVLSSLAVNGYFAAEPLVCRSEDRTDSFIVAEGNRRLVACLILVGDERARNQRSRMEHYQAVHREHGLPRIDPVPIILFSEADNRKMMLSYLGVRHISSAQQWDSYAKAVWIARVVQETDLTTEDVAVMIGDQHRTVARLLEGYNFIRQLTEQGAFQAENSVRKGRGSNTLYPFSWVYTILGYGAVRKFLQLGEDSSAQAPVPSAKLDEAALLVGAMFGDRSKGRSSAVDDSRQLGDLAAAVASPQKVELLRAGKTLRDIEVLTQPLDQRLASGLVSARETLGDINTRLAEQDVGPTVAAKHTDQSGKVKRLAAEVDRRLQEAAAGGGH